MVKKVGVALLAMLGACAACCAIPVGGAMLAALSAAGVANVLCDSGGIALGVGAVALAVVGVLAWRSKRREPLASSCGCAAGSGCR